MALIDFSCLSTILWNNISVIFTISEYRYQIFSFCSKKCYEWKIAKDDFIVKRISDQTFFHKFLKESRWNFVRKNLISEFNKRCYVLVFFVNNENFRWKYGIEVKTRKCVCKLGIFIEFLFFLFINFSRVVDSREKGEVVQEIKFSL